ncbi:MAG: hypothetical protein HC836_32120 [Richelia sp. RM2_1_2]|nr:hypothetical protein [Richelia sp. SM2_1_7]NJM19121.1 hypothetical protein [Richelia sp. SM1_7_0]NJN11395.1 hypothetical protein [Richelia sp. RM1_1_1]NJO28892.1 hypothetical protein [Richelia sp. SL_2_1]NJO62712.1 hypothetical protein [Richelia sp. RM2_1_2]
MNQLDQADKSDDLEKKASKTKSSESSQACDKLLAEALKGKSEAFKKRVLDFALSCGLSQDDPLFLVLIATGQLEVMLEDAPQTLQLLFKTWNRDLARNLEQVEQVAVERQKVAIDRAAHALIRKAQFAESRKLLTAVFPAGLLLFFILGVGVIMGILMPPWIAGILSGGYTKVQSNTLTWDELEAMKWAISKEGKFARNLIDWNRGYLDNGECVEDAQRLGVILSQYGRKAKSGYCVIWATPSRNRKFVN